MKRNRPAFLKLTLVILALLLTAGCAAFPAIGGQTLPGTPFAPTPTLNLSALPEPQAAAEAFLAAWRAENYPAMYAMLTALSRDAVGPADFEQRYRSVAINMTLQSIETARLSALTQASRAQVAYRVVYHTMLIGDLQRDMVMNLGYEDGLWKVQWEDGLILPELRGGKLLALEYKVPARGNIYDRDGHAIATQGDAIALAVVPAELDPAQELELLDALSALTGQPPERILAKYAGVDPTWYVPVGEASAEQVKPMLDKLQTFAGLKMTPYRSRYYYEGGVSAQAAGYVLSIPPERLEAYQRDGYRGDEKVGADGLELWGETYLAGRHGVSLYVKNPDGSIVTRLAQVEPVPSQSLYTTLDKDLQIKLQSSLGDYRAAVVVLEKDTGRVVAMVSNPAFDPNLFEPSNLNSQRLNDVLTNPDNPLLNRATQGLYPLGSVFKIITMSAALESGQFVPESTYVCGLHFTELPGVVLDDWTYTFGTSASGLLTLPEGLMRSCNPWFWHIGLSLYTQGRTLDVFNMARAFGLGELTGIDQLTEAQGDVPLPENEGDAVNQAIGQGSLLVTPLQVARFIAAVGNGGTLYRPQIVDKITTPDGTLVFQFKPEAQAKLPLSADNLKVVQDALLSVVSDRRGTAHFVLANIPNVAGKTGTAQNASDAPHAWFAGYTFANDPNLPDLAVAIIVENAGEGSEIAAPIFRRVVSLYFSDNTDPGGTLPWESRPFVQRGTEEETPAPPQ